jgi:alpha-ketoglutarate-dependent 2,4-dichlorophenoxyacetate dioxygenase
MPLDIRQLADTFAAEVRGIDLRLGLNPSAAEELYDAFLEYGVLLIPGQAIDIQAHLAFARVFGELWELPTWSKNRRIATPLLDDVSNLDIAGKQLDDTSEKLLFQRANLLWHSDLSSNAVAAKASLLHAEEIALEDGRTEFADPRGGYDALPLEMKRRLDGLVGEFNFTHARMLSGYNGPALAKTRETMPSSFHPLVRVHPETGRKNLFLGGNLERILGLPEEESRTLISELTDFTTQPRFVYRHRWAVNDLLIWDNRRALHRATPFDASRYRRVMHRATVIDTGPTTHDGRILAPVIGRHGPRRMELEST